jgi:prefoldin subunit 4
MMRPLSKEEETDAEVTWEDQNNINTFSKLHNKLLDLQDILTDKNVYPSENENIHSDIDPPRVSHRRTTGDGTIVTG